MGEPSLGCRFELAGSDTRRVLTGAARRAHFETRRHYALLAMLSVTDGRDRCDKATKRFKPGIRVNHRGYRESQSAFMSLCVPLCLCGLETPDLRMSTFSLNWFYEFRGHPEATSSAGGRPPFLRNGPQPVRRNSRAKEQRPISAADEHPRRLLAGQVRFGPRGPSLCRTYRKGSCNLEY